MKRTIGFGWAAILVAVGLLWTLSTVRAQQAPDAPDDPDACGQGIVNGGFETDEAWILPVTPYRAGYTTEVVHSGSRSLRAGIIDPTANVRAYSSAVQTVTIPAAVETVGLGFWWYGISTEGSAAAASDPARLAQVFAAGVLPEAPVDDRQYVLLLDENGAVVERLLWEHSDAQVWQEATFDLAAYAGRTLRLALGVYNNGEGGVTAMYVDDVSLFFCTEPGGDLQHLPVIRNDEEEPTPTPTSTPPPSDGVWPDPQAPIEIFSPLADGLYHSPIEVIGFSRTFEGTVNLRLSDGSGAILAERFTQGGSVDGFDFFHTYLRFNVSEEISATLEVFDINAEDGSEIDKLSVPLVLMPGQRVVDVERPRVGDEVCSPLVVGGYSDTFEATVGLDLSARDGTVLTQTIAMGGAWGIYADFSALLPLPVSAPQALLVGAFEGDPRGLGIIDHTRVPVSLYPPGSGPCP